MTVGFYVLPPSAHLSGIIRQHQVIRLRFGAQDMVPPKLYWPRPATALAFYLRDPEWTWSTGGEARRKPRAVLIGQPTAVTWRQGGRDFSVYQIELLPGALFRLTGLDASELTDGEVDAEAVFPHDFAALIHRIEDTDAPAGMIGAAEAWLWQRLQHRRVQEAPDPIGTALLRQPGRSIERLAEQAGLSERQMRRNFIRQNGVAPRLFARVARFDRLVRLRNRLPSEDWLSLAVEAGYYDLRHVRRDFQAFAGATPTVFTAVESTSPERRFGFWER
ncbi:helix-turn-helix domain-containing protein [Asticcacaulis sp. AND118]|uniref:AraC family transcriptional regulator n=1 Tax=Asticcacaulis sp. AND118 TaxID=2840468 RepID=UPI001CFFF8EE|nr:helix-turn-helix domain-containing protein [Asticcacaulis sp. AND118]UDF02678.1 helix-turn-helix domain-containing protein [Asticcacaulis sp. AND118]